MDARTGGLMFELIHPWRWVRLAWQDHLAGMSRPRTQKLGVGNVHAKEAIVADL